MGVKWIKITTDIFDDEKIKIIDTMPARDEIIVIWFKLLTLAGKVNESGLLFMNSKIAYTPEMLSAIFNRELQTVKLALSTFQAYGMIEVEDNEVIAIANWEKHQNIDGMEKIKEDNARRAREYRLRQKEKKLQLEAPSRDVTLPSHDNNAPEEEEEKEIDIIKDIVEFLNLTTGSNYRYTTGKTQSVIKARLNEGFTIDDFKRVIKVKHAEWKDTEYAKFLRPETLFSNKFEGYLNQPEKVITTTKPQKQNNFNNFKQHDHGKDLNQVFGPGGKPFKKR